jgi:hypothetical protein
MVGKEQTMHTMAGERYVSRRLAAMLACVLAGGVAARAADGEIQARFASPGQALAALRDAAKAGDTNALRRLFGPALSEIANPDAIQSANHLRAFAQRLDEFAELGAESNRTVVIRIGGKHWPFPIPLVMTNGQWVFDTPAGREEILNRRIGHNELSAIEVCHAYVQAQRDYASKDRAGSGVMEYAQRLRSTAGKKDGLYWESAPGEEQSPFGPLVARAQEEGYYKSKGGDPGGPTGCTPFHGYVFRILKKQGPDAPGGKYDYIVNGHMVAGFGLLAYPVEWGNSGIMTFIVNQQGKVYQKDLGDCTAELAGTVEEYNPDATWRTAE